MAEVVIVPSAAEAGEIAADAIAAQVSSRADSVLGLATGSTPLTTWKALAALSLDLSRVRGFALDEYVGLPAGHPENYRSVITREVVEPLGLTPSLVRVPGDDGPAQGAGERYEDAIVAAGGVDLQILGIGRTGHIGFNEPGSSLASLTRVKTLTQQTRIDNARFFPSLEDVPTHCITQGLGTILRARHLVLLAFGSAKAAAVAAALEGAVSAGTPGSVVQLHPRVTVILDEDAAADLEHADYYRYAWDNRFDWERWS
ncbi:glucosamine-6-phosphate deaminase [Glaciihabitans arcticus]|uniref:Glucosamine-6-phosphate deaminase n=1 Tax=Glaciihabitans arcticus TaxID=2668039 RepID=A0A4Q9GRX1_9MICO|nr:glucosamine-6-phosphate deaminase [Glaciihabitans arcticus]TBN57732.1 glucosamine-6-phosphate deaminase [Glaciihabitans arcticus]